MVFFTCNACGSSLKKNQVEKHYQNECRNCSFLSCMDCGQDFYGDDYASHTKCISEAEKYQGSMFKGTGSKGDKKQQEWLEKAREAMQSAKFSPRLSSLLSKISQYPNIPRKKSKFENFVRNSCNVRDQKTLEELWDIFNQESQPSTVATEDDPVSKMNGVELLSETASNKQENGRLKEEVAHPEAQCHEEAVESDTKKKKKKKIKAVKDNKNGIEEKRDDVDRDDLVKKRKKKIEVVEMSNGVLEHEEVVSEQTKKKRRKKGDVETCTASGTEECKLVGKQKKGQEVVGRDRKRKQKSEDLGESKKRKLELLEKTETAVSGITHKKKKRHKN